MTEMEPALKIKNLTVRFPTEEGTFKAIDDLDLDVFPGERIAIMGESGCGKSVLGHSIMRLLDQISTTTGNISYLGTEITELPSAAMTDMRGKQFALIPQSPSTSFNPVIKIGPQIDEMYIEKDITKKAAKDNAISALSDVGFETPLDIYNTYSHRLSGGMCERALIAMGSVLNPDLLIADEPTKGLDPANKIEILKLIHKKSKDRILLLITHDYYAAKICERTIIMYSGRIIEDGRTEDVLSDPKHPYTKSLWKSLPDKGLNAIPGTLQKNISGGCDFSNRCDNYTRQCDDPQPMKECGMNHFVRCHDA